MTRVDKRILPGERAYDGSCLRCDRRHIHRDDCPILKKRLAANDGTDPDKPPIPYAGGLQS